MLCDYLLFREGLNPNDNVLPISEKKRVRPRPSKKRPIMKVVEKPVPDELVDTLQSQVMILISDDTALLFFFSFLACSLILVLFSHILHRHQHPI